MLKKYIPVLVLTILSIRALCAHDVPESLALLDFKADHVKSDTQGIFSGIQWMPEDSAALTEALRQKIKARDFEYSFIDESQLAHLEIERQSLRRSVDTLADAGKVVGVDAIIFGNVIQFEAKVNDLSHTSPVGNQELYANLVVDFRIIDVAEGHYIMARKISQTAFHRLSQPDALVDTRRFIDELINSMAKRIEHYAHSIMNPIRILSVTNGYAYLNRGVGQELEQGMFLQAYKDTRPAFDPTTGEVIGGTERYIAQLKVTEVLPKLTAAQILTYTMPVTTEAFCRISFDELEVAQSPQAELTSAADAALRTKQEPQKFLH